MRTANEYRETMMSVFELSISEAEADLRTAWNNGNYERLNILEGYLSGLREGLRKLEASEFLTE